MSKKVSTESTNYHALEHLTSKALLIWLNEEYLRLHTTYETLYWDSYMGDKSQDEAFVAAQVQLQTFRTNQHLAEIVDAALKNSKGTTTTKLNYWKAFFSTYQTPTKVVPIYEEIAKLEKNILHKQTSRVEGYIDPVSKKFVSASRAQMRDIMVTHKDEAMRKACFTATEELAVQCVEELVALVKLRNVYATGLGYADFYEYKLKTEENMKKTELFPLFDELYEKTKYAFIHLRTLEKTKPGLRKPWNRGYLLAGDFTAEADPYFPFEEALQRWGTSFSRLGISFRGSTLKLDLLERAGKYENGFCHWPELIHYKDGKRQTGASNFTCNVAYGQVGSAESGYHTLFHEGGHAAHLLNSDQTEVCINNEYPPSSTAWAETQSIFLDSMQSSIEWKTRYAKDAKGVVYPFSLFEREVTQLQPLRPLAMNSIAMVMNFEKELYEAKSLTTDKVIVMAKKNFKKYTDSSEDSVRLLSIPHIYSFSSACSYHGYGLAYLAVAQWREYFYKKYGAIVDNKKVGKELTAMWKYASAKSFPDCVKLATGKKLSSSSYIKEVTASVATVLKTAKQRISALPKTSSAEKIDLAVHIKMVHGKEVIATNKSSFEAMSKKYSSWLKTQNVNT